jgi:hypothetical protein
MKCKKVLPSVFYVNMISFADMVLGLEIKPVSIPCFNQFTVAFPAEKLFKKCGALCFHVALPYVGLLTSGPLEVVTVTLGNVQGVPLRFCVPTVDRKGQSSIGIEHIV